MRDVFAKIFEEKLKYRNFLNRTFVLSFFARYNSNALTVKDCFNSRFLGFDGQYKSVSALAIPNLERQCLSVS